MAVPVDMDGDGDLDVLSSFSDHEGPSEIFWYENEGNGTFATQQVVAIESDGDFVRGEAVDWDRDGDADIVTLSSSASYWHENDGSGHFIRHPFGYRNWFATFDPIDLDSDGDLDILSSEHLGDVFWYPNNGDDTFGEGIRIVGGGYVDAAADLDGDGDIDVLSGSRWYENDGAGNFQDGRLIATDPNGSNSAVDWDIDGDLDVLSIKYPNGDVAWYENDGLGHFGDRQDLGSVGEWSYWLTGVDLDGDLDLDVLDEGSGVWYENEGNQILDTPQVITSGHDLMSGLAADVDGDGDVDFVSSSHDGRIAWYENRLLGDVNDDGLFDSSDLVKIFQAGQYEDGILNNSTFDTGDWNGDGEFDSSDLVLAFQAGIYEIQPQVNATEFAAAVDWLFAQDQRPARQRAYVS